MSKNEVYSYKERRVLSDDDLEIKFNPNRHTSFTVGDLFRKIIIYGSIILVIYAVFAVPDSKTKNQTIQSFISDTNSIIMLSSETMNLIVQEYNNNNFSTTYKKSLSSKLKRLDEYDLTKYSDAKFTTLNMHSTLVLNQTKACITAIQAINNQDAYTSGIINANLISLRTAYDQYKTLIINFFEKNNIIYEMKTDGSFKYTLP